MTWRCRIETKGGVIRVTARDLSGRRHMAVVTDGAPPVLTPLGAGAHYPCRLAEALNLDDFIIAPPDRLQPTIGEIRATREVAVEAPLTWRSRLQAAAEMDRLSGEVFDELVAQGVPPGAIGLAPTLRLCVATEPAIPVWLATEDEMRLAFAQERKRRGEPICAATVVIAAMAITAYGPSGAAEPAPSIPPDAPRLDLRGHAQGPGVLISPAGAFLIDRGWTVTPAPDAVARLRRSGRG